MSDQQQGGVSNNDMDIDSVAGGFYPHPSPQFSSGYVIPLDDPSDCSNEDSNEGQQLTVFPQPSRDHNSFEEGRDDRGKRPLIPPIEGETLWDNFEPNFTALRHGMLSKKMISGLGMLSDIIRGNKIVPSGEPVKDGTEYILKEDRHCVTLFPQRAEGDKVQMISLKYMFIIHPQYVEDRGLSHTVISTELYESDAIIQYSASEKLQQLKYAGLYDFTITEVSEGPYIGGFEFKMTSQQLCFEKMIEIAGKVVEALIALGDQTNLARRGSQDLQNREEMEKTNPVEEQPIPRSDSPRDRGKINDSRGKNIDLTLTRAYSVDVTPVTSKRLRDRTTKEKVEQLFKLPREKAVELLEQLFDRPREEAAEELCMSLSTFTKFCRKNGIDRWPYQRGKTGNAA